MAKKKSVRQPKSDTMGRSLYRRGSALSRVSGGKQRCGDDGSCLFFGSYRSRQASVCEMMAPRVISALKLSRMHTPWFGSDSRIN